MPRDPRVEKLQRLRTERVTRAAGGYYNTRATAYGNVLAGPRPRDTGRTLLSLIVFVVILCIGLYGAWQYILHGYHAPVAAGGKPHTVVVNVTQGESTSQLGAQLQKEGVIPNAFLFRLYVNLSGSAILPGRHEVSTDMSMDDVVRRLSSPPPPPPVVTLTIRDGWRAEQVADALDKAGIASYADVMNEVKRGTFAYPFLADRPAGASLEGYLMPDTYQFRQHEGAHVALTRLLNNFAAKVTPQMIARGRQRYGSFYNAVIVASIVQREAGTIHDMGLIASVYANRLHDKSGQFTKLNADPTIQYALGKPGNWWPVITGADITKSTANPYNTYTHAGLPPGPIAEPNLYAIEATLNPSPTPYFYFYHVDGSHGKSIFCTAQQGANCPGKPQ